MPHAMSDGSPPPLHRSRQGPGMIALGVSYNGRNYSGWQSQPGAIPFKTISKRPWAALPRTRWHHLRRPHRCRRARADAGGALRHPARARARFPGCAAPTPFARRHRRAMGAAVPDSFHCRACAVARRYAYVLLRSPCAPAWMRAASAGCSMRWTKRPCGRRPCNTCWASMTSRRFAPAPARPSRPSRRCSASASRGAARPPENPPATMAARPCYWRFEFEGTLFAPHDPQHHGLPVAIGQGCTRPTGCARCWRYVRDAAAPTFARWPVLSGPVYAAEWACPRARLAYDWLP